MASVQVFKPSLSPISRSDLGFGRELSCFCGRAASEANKKRILRLKTGRNSKDLMGRGLRVRCGREEGENRSKGEEPPESLFMKELRRRGLTPTSLLEDRNLSSHEIDEQVYLNETERETLRRNAVSIDLEKDVLNQRKRSMALNSEGLEGLVPRAKLLLTIGGTFFFGFGPLILIIVAFFSALYLFFGSTFVHDANNFSAAPPQYVDPYTLLEDGRLS